MKRSSKPKNSVAKALVVTVMEPTNVGRPSGYDPKYAEELINYFSKEPYEKIANQLYANDFPTLAGFAIKIGFHRDTLHEWAKVHSEFSDAYKRVRDFQENWLLVNGMRGLVPPAFCIFTSKNVIGFRDRAPEENDNSGKASNANKSTAEIEAEILKLMAAVNK